MFRLSGVVPALALLAGCAAQPAAVGPTDVPPPTTLATQLPTATPLVIQEPTATADSSVPVVPTLEPTTIPVLAPTQVEVAVATDAPASSADASLADTTATADTATGPPSAEAQSAQSPCDITVRPDPLPAPGSPRAQDFFRSFRLPLPPAPLYDPPGQKRVGLQAGHWQTDQVPAELGRLQNGAVGGGKQEWQVNLDVAQRAATLLEASGIAVDVLPATIPPRYEAHVFVALHADGDPNGVARGFKVARPGFSSIPDIDDRLVAAFNQTYGSETELPRDDEHISLRMRYYYAFNSRRYCHAVAPGVPQAIVEMAYLTSSTDQQYLIGDPDRLAHAVADSVQSFLATEP